MLALGNRYRYNSAKSALSCTIETLAIFSSLNDINLSIRLIGKFMPMVNYIFNWSYIFADVGKSLF